MGLFSGIASVIRGVGRSVRTEIPFVRGPYLQKEKEQAERRAVERNLAAEARAVARAEEQQFSAARASAEDRYDSIAANWPVYAAKRKKLIMDQHIERILPKTGPARRYWSRGNSN